MNQHEKRIITVSAYRTPDGAPTCRTKAGMCTFLGAARFGTLDVCAAHQQRALPENGSGYLQPPQDGCIVWPQGEA